MLENIEKHAFFHRKDRGTRAREGQIESFSAEGLETTRRLFSLCLCVFVVNLFLAANGYV